ncbi:MAG: hypothetical protein ACXIT9_02185 [Nitritalea sp.]
MKYYKWTAVILLIIFTTLIPLILYWYKFGSFNFSSDFDQWVKFSNFLSPFFSIGLTIVLIVLSWQSLQINKINEKPIVILKKEVLNGFSNYHEMYYVVQNIGNGPAVDIRLFIEVNKDGPIDQFFIKKNLISLRYMSNRKTNFDYMVNGIHLSYNEKLEISWQKDIKNIVVTYGDVYNERYSILCESNNYIYRNEDVLEIDNNGIKNNIPYFNKDKTSTAAKGPKNVFSLGEIKGS